jgi:hypothetical protein
VRVEIAASQRRTTIMAVVIEAANREQPLIGNRAAKWTPLARMRLAGLVTAKSR